MKRLFGLIGFPLEHSGSAKYFAEIFYREGISDAEYTLFPMKDISEIRLFLKANNISGFSVTIPHKITIIQFLDEISEEAGAIGAVNTVKVYRRESKMYLKGFNTDSPAFQETLAPYLPIPKLKALVLGNGGASRAVCYALKKLNIPWQIVSRNPHETKQLSYHQLTDEIISNHLLIVNTTPVGMFPETNQYPEIPYNFITPAHIVYDLIYNPSEPIFLKMAGKQGAKIINGLEMLHRQAEIAWKIFNMN